MARLVAHLILNGLAHVRARSATDRGIFGNAGATGEPLPKSGPGKVLKRVLREPYWEGHDRAIN